MMNAPRNPNRSLVHIFCVSLCGLLFVYSTIAVYGLVALENINATELATGVLRIALGLLALGILFCCGRLAAPLERQAALMGACFEAHYANLSTTTTIRSIV